jgi:hypothetical protein
LSHHDDASVEQEQDGATELLTTIACIYLLACLGGGRGRSSRSAAASSRAIQSGSEIGGDS